MKIMYKRNKDGSVSVHFDKLSQGGALALAGVAADVGYILLGGCILRGYPVVEWRAAMASEIPRVNELVAQQGWSESRLLYYYERFIVIAANSERQKALLVAYLEDCAETENAAETSQWVVASCSHDAPHFLQVTTHCPNCGATQDATT